jgi:hypothetical protein
MIELTRYNAEVESIELRFDLMRFTLNSTATQKRFLIDKKSKEFTRIDKFYQKTREQLLAVEQSFKPELIDKLLGMSKKLVAREIKKKFKLKNVNFYGEICHDTLNQCELLIIFANFESFLKRFHGELLRAAPHKVFGHKSNQRSIFLSTVFQNGYADLKTSDFLKGEVEREVRELDKQTTSKKAAYFKKFFGFDLCNASDLSIWEEVSELRNTISHHFSNPEKVTFVNDETVQNTRSIFRRIPQHACEIAKEKFKLQVD